MRTRSDAAPETVEKAGDPPDGQFVAPFRRGGVKVRPLRHGNCYSRRAAHRPFGPQRDQPPECRQMSTDIAARGAVRPPPAPPSAAEETTRGSLLLALEEI